MGEHDESPTSPFGPIKNPVDRFAHLPEFTRAWLEGLSREDIAAHRGLSTSYRRASTVGWFLKWLGLITGGVFTASVTFGEGVRKIAAWFVVG